MIISVRAAPINSVVLLSDIGGGEIPRSMEGGLISSTKSCVAIGCRSESDGETAFALGPAIELEMKTGPVFEGVIETPTRKIVIRSILGQTILEASVPTHQTAVRIWANHDTEPDEIFVGIV